MGMKLGTASAVDKKQNNRADALLNYLRRRPWGPILVRKFAHLKAPLKAPLTKIHGTYYQNFDIQTHAKEAFKGALFCIRITPQCFWVSVL